MMATVNEALQGARTAIRKTNRWFIALGAVFILLGIFAIIEPVIAGLAVTILVGWLLIFGGIAHLITAVSGGGTRRVVWQFLAGIVYVLGGFYFLTNPLLGLGALTLVLAGIILAEAVFEFVAYYRTRQEEGSCWLLVNALITLVLSALIWLHWPSSSVWAIGTLVGVDLLMTGVSRLMLGVAARTFVNRAAT